MAKKREINEYSTDPAAQQMLIRAEELGIGTAFTRADNMAPCNIGGAGMCCKQCGMGPCRLTKSGDVGVCGATLDTVQARNLTRAIAAGSAAHSDHGRDMAFLLKATAEGEAEGYMIRDVGQLAWLPPTMTSRSKVAPRRKLQMTWQTCISRSSASNVAKLSLPGARPRNDSSSGANAALSRAA
jgi:hydroxylamine reductase (hybrid-cluster protein)